MTELLQTYNPAVHRKVTRDAVLSLDLAEETDALITAYARRRGLVPPPGAERLARIRAELDQLGPES
jgi:hypothetical protein